MKDNEMNNYKIIKKEKPTFYFIGVTTFKSSIMKIFPLWMRELGKPEIMSDAMDQKIDENAENGIAWGFNYRGELDFMHQAERQKDSRGVKVEDGWIYFVHGWTQVISQVLHIEITE